MAQKRVRLSADRAEKQPVLLMRGRVGMALKAETRVSEFGAYFVWQLWW